MMHRALMALPPLLLLIPPVAMFSGLALTPALILLCLLCVPLLVRQGLRSHDLNRGIVLALVALFLWALASIPLSGMPMNSYVLWSKLLFLCVAGILCFQALFHADSAQKRQLRQAVVHGGALAMLFLLWEISTLGSISVHLQGDKSFYLDRLNRGACVLALIAWPFLAAVALMLNRPSWLVRSVSVCLWAVGLGTLKHLESQSAIMAYIAATLAFLFVYLLRGRCMMVCIAVVLLPLLAVPLIAPKLSPDTVMNRFISLPESALHRLYIWRFTGDKALEKPLFGHGFDAARSIPGGREKVVHHGIVMERWEKLPLHPHNSALQIWLELGWVGVLLYGLLVAGIVRGISASALTVMEKANFIAGAVAYLTMSMTAYGVWQEWWVAASFIAAAYLAVITDSRRGIEPTRKAPGYQAFPDDFRR